MGDIKALLAAAKLPEATVELCLRGDLNALHETALSALNQEQRKAVTSLAGGGQLHSLAQRIQDLEAEMAASTITVVLRAPRRGRWAALVAAHPIRDGNTEDKSWGFDSEALFEALLRETVVDPVLTAAEFVQLLDAMSDGQYESLARKALDLARGTVSVPFSPAASQILASSASA